MEYTTNFRSYILGKIIQLFKTTPFIKCLTKVTNLVVSTTLVILVYDNVLGVLSVRKFLTERIKTHTFYFIKQAAAKTRVHVLSRDSTFNHLATDCGP